MCYVVGLTPKQAREVADELLDDLWDAVHYGVLSKAEVIAVVDQA